ncbi:hypothetical protein TURU_104643 [Turdus rufiventris]|nr:hypothetical protein TURU_104643 [Turdus rufiventris]
MEKEEEEEEEEEKEEEEWGGKKRRKGGGGVGGREEGKVLSLGFSVLPASQQASTQQPTEKSCPQYPYQSREIPWATEYPCTNSAPPDRPGH